MAVARTGQGIQFSQILTISIISFNHWVQKLVHILAQIHAARAQSVSVSDFDLLSAKAGN